MLRNAPLKLNKSRFDYCYVKSLKKGDMLLSKIKTINKGDNSQGDFIHRERRILQHGAPIKYHVINCSAHIACLALPDFREASFPATSRFRPLGSRASLLRVFGACVS